MYKVDYRHVSGDERLVRSLLLILVIKLLLVFAVLKVFFFQDFLNERFKTDEQKSAYVVSRLTGEPSDAIYVP